jgi:hypothetical protein
MKGYRQLISEIKSRKVVFAFGRFQPPTIGHELLVKAVQRIAQEQGADHVIFASRSQDKKSNPLSVKDKVYFLKRMFPSANFMAAGENTRTFIEVAKELNKKYKSIVMVGGSDRVAEFQRILTTYNGKEFHYDSIEVKSAGERDPDSDTAAGMSGTKMRMAAKDGDFNKFKSGLPSTLTAVDSRRLFNAIRSGMGLDAIKEEIEFERDTIRENYHAGKILHVGETVKDKTGLLFEIVDRGSNYVTVVNESGDLSRKWIYDVVAEGKKKKIQDSTTYFKNFKTVSKMTQEDVSLQDAPPEVEFKGYKSKWLHHSKEATDAFSSTIQKYNNNIITDPVAILNALKATDAYMKIADDALEAGSISDAKYQEFMTLQAKAKESLERVQDWLHHEDYWHSHAHEMAQMNLPPQEEVEESLEITEERLQEMKFNSADKIKVARIIGMSLGVEKIDTMSNPTMIINTGLRKLRNKRMTPEMKNILTKMLETAKMAGIEYDEKLIPAVAPKEEMKESVEPQTFMTYYQFRQQLAAAGHAHVGSSLAPGDPRMAHRKAHAMMEEAEELDESEEDAAKAAEIADLRARQAKEKHQLVKKQEAEREKIMSEEEEKEDEVEVDDEDFSDEIESITDPEHILHLYDDEELAVIDDEGNEVEDDDDDDEEDDKEQVDEAISRIERMKRKIRFARTKSKRERRRSIAIKRRSTQPVINRRARKHAILMLKKRLARKPLDKLSVQEKERLERIVQQRKKLIDRLAVRLAPKIRKIESERLRHQKFTKEDVDQEIEQSNIELDESSEAGLAAKAKKSGISIGTLRKVYRRGVAAWNSGHRPGTTPQQWGMARVNSYITKGKGTYHGADKDLREGGEPGEFNVNDIDEACWTGYKQVGLKKKGNKMVPNCVPEEADIPHKYRAGLSDKTAAARAAHWKEKSKLSDSDPRAYEPAPGDKTAKTKLSKFTKKYRAMYGEEIEEYISDEEFEQILQMEDVTVEYATEEEVAQFDTILEAEYQGRDVPLGKPMAGDVKKSKVYVKDPDTGNVIKVNFGDKNMTIKKSNPARRKSFRARHNCADAKDRTTPRYWSCKAW